MSHQWLYINESLKGYIGILIYIIGIKLRLPIRFKRKMKKEEIRLIVTNLVQVDQNQKSNYMLKLKLNDLQESDL